MLKPAGFLLFIFFSFQIHGQNPTSGPDTINFQDAKGRKQGYWRKKDSLGSIQYEGRFVNGFPDGEFRYYYPNGSLKAVSMISQQGKRAHTVSYFKNGRKLAAGVYIDEKKDSIWQFFNEYDGSLVLTEGYRKGIREGLSKVWYPSGVMSELFYYKNGIKSGLWEQYYLDGKLKLRGAFLNGEKNGAFKIFYNSGGVMISGAYHNGHQDGEWNYFTEKGVPSKTEIFDKGTLVKSIEKNP